MMMTSFFFSTATRALPLLLTSALLLVLLSCARWESEPDEPSCRVMCRSVSPAPQQAAQYSRP